MCEVSIYTGNIATTLLYKSVILRLSDGPPEYCPDYARNAYNMLRCFPMQHLKYCRGIEIEFGEHWDYPRQQAQVWFLPTRPRARTLKEIVAILVLNYCVVLFSRKRRIRRQSHSSAYLDSISSSNY